MSASIRVGSVVGLMRYPVKSMAGEPVESVDVGWHGLEGDRRLAFRRLGERGGFPWLSASRLPEMVCFTPSGRDPVGLPTHVRTPEGAELELFGAELAADVGRRFGSPVEMMYLDRGIFDEASVSVISVASIQAVERLAAISLDARRFRPNVVLETDEAVPFFEDAWVGGTLTFGKDPAAPVIGVTNWDVRCAMVNFDPDTGKSSPEILKTIVRERDNKLGVYGAVMRPGRIEVGQAVSFAPTQAGPVR